MASSAAGVVLGLTPLEPEPEQRGPGRIIGAPGGRSECVQADPKYILYGRNIFLDFYFFGYEWSVSMSCLCNLALVHYM